MADSNALAAWHTPSNVLYVNCLLDIGRGEWMSPSTANHFKGKRTKDIVKYKCIIRKHNRTAVQCQKCQRSIGKNDVIVGIPIKSIRGPYGFISLWRHVDCAVPALVCIFELQSSKASQAATGKTLAKQDGEAGTHKDNAGASKSGKDLPSSGVKTRRGRKPKVEATTKDEAAASSADAPKSDGAKAKGKTAKGKAAKAAKDESGDKEDSKGTDETGKGKEEPDPLMAQLVEHAYGFDSLGALQKVVVAKIRLAMEYPDELDEEFEIRDAVETVAITPELESLPQPPELLVPLLPFQRDGVTWMYHQEKGPVKGGILADEMGMGKTIQTIALLIAAKRDALLAQQKAQAIESGADAAGKSTSRKGSASSSKEAPQVDSQVTYKPESKPESKGKKGKKSDKKDAKNVSMLNRRGCTLIVSPLAALLQWYNEIKTKVADGYLSVLLYHGPHRKSLTHVLHEYDVVLTTYAIVEAEFRKVQNKSKIACEFCGRMYLHKTLVLHQKYFCGPTAIRTEKQRLSERKADSGSIVLKIHARLFPDIKKAVDEINAKKGEADNEAYEDDDNDSSGSPKRQKVEVEMEVEEEDPEDEDYFGAKLLKIEITDAFTTLGIPEKDVESALGSLSSGVKVFVEQLKVLAEKSNVREMKQLELLERFASSDELDMGLLKSTRVVELKSLLGHFGLSAFGSKTELINKVIVFINKMRRLSEQYSEASIATKSAENKLPIGVTGGSPDGDMQNVRVKLEFDESSIKKLVSKKKILDNEEAIPDYDATPSSMATIEADNAESDGSYEDDEEATVVRRRLRSGTTHKDKEASTSGGKSGRDMKRKRESISNTAIKVKLEDGTGDGLATQLPEKATEIKVKMEPDSANTNVYKPLKSHVKKETVDQKRLKPLPSASDETICEGSVLHEMVWDRIVIDEAHRIKTKSNSTSQAIIRLRSSGSRWCLTGTPLQNRVGDVFSLISFLKMYPFAHNFCGKYGCSCECTEFSCSDFKYCDFCGHSRILHYSYFNKRILKPILSCGYSNEGQVAMSALHNDVLGKIMLRRTKAERAKDVNLPPMHVTIRRDVLSDFERDFYEALYKQSAIKFDTYARSGTLLHNYAHIFDLLTRLRQAVDHPYLILYGPSSLAMKASNAPDPKTKAELEATVSESLPAAGSERSCGLCFDKLTDSDEFCTSNCKHSFHQPCLNDYLQSRPDDVTGDDNNVVTCPTCYAALTIKIRHTPQVEEDSPARTGSDAAPHGTSKHSILQHIKLSEFKSSTKIEALFAEISEILTTTTDKCLVFSQYCSMLELISFRLKTAQVQCAVLAGSTSLEARRNMLLEFNNNPNLRVMLISLKAGGEGLNLQIANRIFLMDPWWNPASELQAIQRAHRIGQTKPVYAVRFICKDTIEERIIELQEKKMIVFDATISSSAESMAKLSSEDLSFLFKR
ncbi:DNA repair protein rhp16, putative [Babesia bigemina]|uniref:DNA repair protein rhp16, putative n=1 Tax=Babesia bigemina TaxID=5866 RepID=A0A061DDE0_BABBI|nr:DNA repair protein rhp16, putative [Babesia bigemina]CDR97304.1 DNA repair protein rhp16, putative [Babesia bigemina]|eukprot:XP_012769490.1 DNA repair protein rhp16, putative [Babesia bigemina]